MGGRLLDCIVTNCQITGSVTTTINDYGYSTGGLAAILYNSTLSNCHSTCSVSGTGNVGGMIGNCSLSTIFDCHSSGNVGHSTTTTYSKIGGFAGQVLGSSLSKIFSTGNVTATGDYTSGNTTGGFVGHSSSYYFEPYQSNLISDCYCSGNVSGGSKIGGFVGTNYCASGTSTITKCYSRGIITGTGSVWGFVGENSGTIYNCYFDADVDGLSYTVSGTSVYGSIGKSTAEMKTQSTYTDWDFTFIWGIGEGNNDGYPYLLPSSTCSDGTIVLTSGPESQTVCYGTAISPIVYTIGGGATGAEVSGLPDGLTGALSGETFTITGTSTVSGSFPYTVTTSGAVSPCINATATGTITIFGYSGGNGTESNPFQIATLADLKFLSENSCHWDKHFIQTADIDASATNTWDDGKGWLAIGTSTAPFYGTYDGMLHTISNLYINRPYAGNQGLFGYISNFLTQISMVKNLGVTNVNINARNNIGGLVGFNLGDVSNCYSTGTVVASNVEVGGLVGQNKGSITYCYSEADVTGYWLVGGLVGNTNGYGSEIINCYSRGSVTSVSEGSGGLVGVIMYDALIRNCYSTGLMNNSGAGGLVGLIDGVGSVVNSFWDVETSGVNVSAGGTAKTTAEMKTQSTFTGWDFMTIWGINAGNNDGYPHLITESACVDGALYLVSGLNTQTVYTNSSIIPIVYFVGGGASGVSISPATLPPKFSGIYDPVNGTYTISGLCQANYTLNYSLTTTGTKFPCKEATVSGIIKVIIQPSVNITGTNSPICYGSDAKFYLQGTTGVEVTYSLDGGATTSTVILVEGKATIEVKGATSDKTLSLISARNTEYGCTFPLKGTSAVIVNNLPAASISGDHEGCVSTTLTAGTDASTPIYEWYKEGVLLAGESNSTLVATQAGSYTVKVTDGITKCSDISDDFAVILSTHTVSITANNQPICYGSDAEFSLEGTPGTVVTYSFDGGTSQSTIPLDAGSASVIYKQAVGDVTLSLISIELTATGCTRELTETSTVEIYIPTAIISGNQVSCVSTTLTAETDALMPIYEWHKDGALIAGESSSTLTVTQSGAYKLMVSDVSTKCSNISGDFNVTINPLPEVTITGNNSSICYITDAEFYLEGTPGAEVTYNFNGGTNRTRVLGEGITTVTFDEAPYDITLSLESIYNPSTGCRKFSNTESTVFVNPDPKVSIDGYHEDCQSTTLKAVTDTPNPVYAWLIAEGEEPIQVGDGSTLEVTQSDDYYLFVTDKITGCFAFSGPFAVSINPLPAVAITGNNSIIIGETTTVSPITGGTWKSNNEAIATITDGGIVKGIAQGTATFTFTDENTGCKATTDAISVTGAPPVFTTCPGAQTANAVAGLCSAVVTYEASASGSPEPIMTYEFSGATIGSGSGSGSGTAFNTGDTYVTISVSNGIAPDATCSFTVTVTDNEAPEITCAPDVAQNVDPGMCSAVVNVVTPTPMSLPIFFLMIQPCFSIWQKR
ncbi:the GLUG motif [Bacteroidales bacterium 6E]|nr:the GLUG motif [Bacteroidales bacterium 6E]